MSSATATNENAIHWKQLWSLAALYASVLIGWIAYYRYQPKLLEEFQFTQFTFLLVVAQAIIIVVTPPIAGRLGDKYRVKKGHRLPIITAGISFAAMIFMAVAFTLFLNPGPILKWALPVMIICWLVGMSIFTSPALSTVELFAPIEKLPRAIAILTIVSNLVYALEPVIVDIIDFLGAPITFVTGGLVVSISGYALKKNSLSLFRVQPDRSQEEKGSKVNYPFLFLLGIVLGFATTILLNIYPGVLETKLDVVLGDIRGNVMVACVLVLAALASLPASSKVNQYGLKRSFWISAAVMAITMAMIIFSSMPYLVIACLIIFAISFASLSVSALPLVIRHADFNEKVFCVGIFFSGVALPDGIVEIIIAY